MDSSIGSEGGAGGAGERGGGGGDGGGVRRGDAGGGETGRCSTSLNRIVMYCDALNGSVTHLSVGGRGPRHLDDLFCLHLVEEHPGCCSLVVRDPRVQGALCRKRDLWTRARRQGREIDEREVCVCDGD